MIKKYSWLLFILVMVMFINCTNRNRAAGINESEIVIQRSSDMIIIDNVKMRVFINGEKKLSLRNGAQGKIIVPNGNYTIYVSLTGFLKSKMFPVELNSERIIISAAVTPPGKSDPGSIELVQTQRVSLSSQPQQDRQTAGAKINEKAIIEKHESEKYALVIGNSNYVNFGTLQNPLNDANDMELVLQSLGFTVDKILNGSLNQMEDAAIRLKNRLSEAGNSSYGFFFYAGHGLEMDGVNYLIPSDANIPERNFLRERAFSVSVLLNMLNDSRNALNIVVLDACRDFPTAWSRSLNRGLAVISNPPANHIIIYATGAGATANDGIERNGLFTSHLLNNLKQPWDVNEIFRRTMVDVSRASNNEQRPALYTDFGETVFF